MQCIDTTEVAKLSDALESVLKELPEMRKKVHEEIGADILKIVRKNIGGSINDAHGKIRGWQEDYIGSRGGYAAVRPIGGKGPKGYDDSPGAITNYLESGHAARDGGRTYGRYFYRGSTSEAERVGEKRADALAEEIAKKLEGKR